MKIFPAPEYMEPKTDRRDRYQADDVEDLELELELQIRA